jgi:hypothetical protein
MKPKLFVWFLLTAAVTTNVWAATLYVDLNSTNPASPYAELPTAATNIQDAVDASTNGDLILVNDGIYQTGFRTTDEWGAMMKITVTNRVVVNKPVTVQSLNGPSAAFINGGGRYRGVYLTNGATLGGFTLASGATGWRTLFAIINVNGGGVIGIRGGPGGANFGGGVVSNCVLTGNSATGNGGGASGATLINCILNNNYAQNGGGADSARLVNCLVTSNSTPTFNNSPGQVPGQIGTGGGICSCSAINCVITRNIAWQGGGTYGGTELINCTIVSNSAAFDGGVYLPNYPNPAIYCVATNCIIYYNSAGTNANFGAGGVIVQSCTTPMPASGSGNLTNEPAFLDFAHGDYHLASDSLLINSGINAAITNSTDLDGNPRIAGRTVDIGAYEYQLPTSALSYAWAQQYGFPTDGSADGADPDCDGMSNWQEFMAGTNPTNAASVLAMASATPINNLHWVNVKWQSVSTRTYYLLRSCDLASGFTCISSNIVGNSGTTTYMDTTATNGGPYYYRVGVQ